jgi:hypothetical protein
MIVYRPPPAQAQAQPAQAQAQAQTQLDPPPPPPPRNPPLDELVDTFGAGLVTEVTLEVNSLIFPTTFDEKVCTPFVMDLVKSAPGTRAPPPIEAGAAEVPVAALPKVGS